MAIEDFYRELEVVEVNNTEDGLGGFTEGVRVIKTIQGTITRSSNKEIKIAEKMSNKSYYFLYTNIGSEIGYNDIIKKDNVYFRITSIANDRVTPNISDLEFEKFECEIYEINS